MKIIRITLDDKLQASKLTRYALAKRTDLKYQTIDNYYKNKVKRYDSDILLKICIALECQIGEIIKIVEI